MLGVGYWAYLNHRPYIKMKDAPPTVLEWCQHIPDTSAAIVHWWHLGPESEHDKSKLKLQKPSLRKKKNLTCTFSLAHLPSANVERAGSMTYTATRGRLRCFGFTFVELWGHPSLYTINDLNQLDSTVVKGCKSFTINLMMDLWDSAFSLGSVSPL